MPFGRVSAIEPVMRLIWKINPISILDVGCGIGLYAPLIRTYVDMQFYKDTRSTVIDAIENDLQSYNFYGHYNHIFHRDISKGLSEVLNQEEPYHLVMFNFVLEYFEKDEALRLIDVALKKSENVIVSICHGHFDLDPIVPRDSGIKDEDWSEKDFSGWDRLVESDKTYIAWKKGSKWQDRGRPDWKDMFDANI